ncbi:nicotinate (nicotinamide) nucleotide adenylyltransferase [Erysipelothrix urinaevulpis]|uniref:nicotinate (nicotinamide) nucleotide adenylyltransferase n=1 Tax=Erysipelothrix urinaevulpis TaxID=2683717 RepID=UPI0013589E4D|nr:nicotinate (nicotinamide) nucleotide adenylyltransferase [Erysipelothrix urinaevulpis]
MKVVLFGGSFDPIHDGHLNMALLALTQRKADEVWFIPNQVSPFKQQKTSFKDRLKMVELMIENHPQLKVFDLEGQSLGPSYTIDTIKQLQTLYPTIQFEFLIGDDQVLNLSKWKDYDELMKRVQFIVYSRLSQEHDFPTVSGDIISVSSSEIRQGNSFKTSKEVLRYMMKKGLYLDEMIKERLSSYRYEHSLRVTKLALELGEHHGLDTEQIYLCAMWHDAYKEDPNLDKMIHEFLPEMFDKPQAFYHAYLAAYSLKHSYYVDCDAVYDAIWNHVDGGSKAKLAKILYIADKCEPKRNYDTETLLTQCFEDLDKGFEAVKKDQENYLKRSRK